MTNQRGYQICEINITPLTDIFLVLLVIMMVVTPMIDFAGLNMAVMTVSDQGDPNAKPKTLLVSVDAKGEYTIDGKIVPTLNLADVLREKAPENPDGLLIEVEEDTPHEALARAVAAATTVGVTKLAVHAKEPPPAEGEKHTAKHKKK